MRQLSRARLRIRWSGALRSSTCEQLQTHLHCKRIEPFKWHLSRLHNATLQPLQLYSNSIHLAALWASDSYTVYRAPSLSAGLVSADALAVASAVSLILRQQQRRQLVSSSMGSNAPCMHLQRTHWCLFPWKARHHIAHAQAGTARKSGPAPLLQVTAPVISTHEPASAIATHLLSLVTPTWADAHSSLPCRLTAESNRNCVNRATGNALMTQWA